ncbi:MAG: EAL domain-containing protein [Candidatus Accumulibacter sp.]|jgi:diguanylate cyclase (GGDEF)-like protein/PAS domain S-box-containing protein|nr:EAL domain-containing protein [Accumulibacter sp.]
MISSDQSELLLGHGNEILLLVDLAMQDIRAANDAAARHLGYTRDELIGRPITDIVCALTDIFYWEDVRQGNVADVHNVETSYLRADGELLHVSRSIIHPASHPGTLVVCAIPTGRLRRTENELANTVARLHATLEATADGILLLDRDGAIVNMNRQFSQVWRIPDEPLLTHEHDAVFAVMASRMADPKAYRRRLAEIRPDSDDETHDLLALADGRFLERKSRPARLGKTIIGRVFSFADISEHKARESRLALAASVFSHAHEGIMITDAAGNVVDVNATFCHITGYTREEVIGQNPRFLRSGRQGKDFYHAMWSELAAYGHWEGELWNRRKDGRFYEERLSITVIQDSIDASLHYVAIISDITELKGYQRQIEHMTYYDALTGMPNRVLLADRLNLAIAQARRYPRYLVLVYLDIDGFKEVNDTHDRETGDQLLITIAHRLRDTLREGDTLARLGGDEFVALITDLDNQVDCKPILNRLLNAAAMPVKVQRHAFQLSASMGVTLFPQDDSDADTLLRHAAQTMYQAKQTGRNRYRLFDPQKEQQTQTRHKNLERVAQAIAQDEFELYFQPKVNMRSGSVAGVEALLRWRHPERGLVMPGDFLPPIEGSDLMVRLGDWVLDTALAQMSRWRRQGLDIAVSVNIAARHLQQADFLSNLEKKLAACPMVSPECLEIEVLETAALEGIARISELIEGCQALGVRFSLDDFGTGYSSLTYLRRLPANILKIDQSFVRDMLSDSGDMAIVEGIIGLAAAFGKTVIAEGVETAEHGRLLLRLGCELAQGYGIARPMPASELPTWIATWRPPSAWRGVSVSVRGQKTGDRGQ